MNKEDLYKNIKVAGMVLYIPVLLFTGPFFGFLAGNFLQDRLGLPTGVLYVSISLGFLASVMEILRIIRIARKLIG